MNLGVLLSLFLATAKVGCVAYGGGPSMIPILKVEVVDNYQWMTTEEFMDVLAIGNALPGAIAVKMTAVVGYKVAGTLGMTVCVLGIILPGTLLVFALLGTVNAVRDRPWVASMLRGLGPVVVALIAYTAYDMVPTFMRGAATWIIGAAALGIMIFTKIHPALLVVAGACLGVALRL